MFLVLPNSFILIAHPFRKSSSASSLVDTLRILTLLPSALDSRSLMSKEHCFYCFDTLVAHFDGTPVLEPTFEDNP